MAEHDTPEMIAAIRAGCSPWHERPCQYPLCDCAPVVPDMIRASVTAYEAARPPADDGWRPIKTAPRDRQTIDLWVAFDDTGEAYRLAECWWETGHWRWRHGALHRCRPTHWRPLPAPPEDGNAG